jgi:protein-tyrosine phosphatase
MTKLQGVANFRELGGLPASDSQQIRSGVMYRSGHLADTTEADREQLLALGIRTVVDLRTDHDLEADGDDVLPDGITRVHAPIHDDAGYGSEIRRMLTEANMDEVRAAFGDGKAHEMALHGSAAMAEKGPRMESFRPAFEVVMDPASWPVLWHCSAGKDRAGWTATAVLLAVGTDPGTIVDHYLASNGRGLSGTTNWGTDELREVLEPFVSVHADYVEAQMVAVDTDWGGIDSLLQEGHGIGPDQVGTLRHDLLESR